ncbi:ITSN [Mytilus coruscus]|uniref:ITSN n=1 Tax=Mytilus coruscus TaxID=42192 RepID=A0A6J8EXB3_MYTCO|nr:ITSN [Mytilus coruscus]
MLTALTVCQGHRQSRIRASESVQSFPAYSQVTNDHNGNSSTSVYEGRRPLPQTPSEQRTMLPPLPPRGNATYMQTRSCDNRSSIEENNTCNYSFIKDDSSDDDEMYYNITVDNIGISVHSAEYKSRKDEEDTYINYDEASQDKGTPTSTQSVIAVRSYSAKYNNELGFEKGTTINVVAKVSDRWLIGEIQDKRGVFPSEYTKQYTDAFSSHKAEIEVTEVKTAKTLAPFAVIAIRSYTAKHQNEISFEQEDKFDVIGFESDRWLIGKIEQEMAAQDLPYNVIAIQPYQAKQENEISFSKDAKFDVVAKISELWLIGDINGKRGLFPSNCVKKCNFSMPKRISEADGKEIIERKSASQLAFSVIAIKSYQAETNDELTFSKDQKISVLRQETEQWLVGEINVVRGLIPSECVTRVNLY